MQLKLVNSIILCFVFFFSLFGLPSVFGATQFSVHTDKSVYEYGDHLSIIFEVPEVTSETLSFQIIDDSGKASSPISISITKMKTEITSPYPFYKTTFKPGTYHIAAKYSSTNSSGSFTLLDNGTIAIPLQYKNIIKLWSEGQQPTDTNFANVIRDLIQYDIIEVTELKNQTTTIHIPTWVKNNAKWWSDDLISDNDFGLGIQYMLKSKIMTL